ncbi:uncharacterized protein LOC110230136 [Arabidopsis lyrata subsp. lyrata]|uniref:uncharacterized protein LOC110230136 n=1 Tax=Arabidopsis lyrata subsp. lyrata TaxID=81972 RepID=UPI000A29DE2C|nr:uncharacterized protein LOC110230136 [Arabidopsis lyrata subsp. lyrata]|eukprot:XP_020887794.1 uncharacterized protein LOC110230136 [Arabidopsis lyrata subsp. lyrata]
MKFITLVFIAFFVVLGSDQRVVVRVEEEEKVACIWTDLRVCLSVVQAESQPSMQCCIKLKEQAF